MFKPLTLVSFLVVMLSPACSKSQDSSLQDSEVDEIVTVEKPTDIKFSFGNKYGIDKELTITFGDFKRTFETKIVGHRMVADIFNLQMKLAEVEGRTVQINLSMLNEKNNNTNKLFWKDIPSIFVLGEGERHMKLDPRRIVLHMNEESAALEIEGQMLQLPEVQDLDRIRKVIVDAKLTQNMLTFAFINFESTPHFSDLFIVSKVKYFDSGSVVRGNSVFPQ